MKITQNFDWSVFVSELTGLIGWIFVPSFVNRLFLSFFIVILVLYAAIFSSKYGQVDPTTERNH